MSKEGSSKEVEAAELRKLRQVSSELLGFRVIRTYDGYRKHLSPNKPLFNFSKKVGSLVGKGKIRDKEIRAIIELHEKMKNAVNIDLIQLELNRDKSIKPKHKEELLQSGAESRKILYCALFALKPQEKNEGDKPATSLGKLCKDMIDLIEKMDPSVKNMSRVEKESRGKKVIESTEAFADKKSTRKPKQ